jgi:tripartite-type tricarboxylate transporter receptor subunit TctC
MRTVTRIGSLAAALVFFALAAHAQPYPSKPITIVVGFTAGGTTDIIARLIGERLNKAWGQPIVIDNKPGAGGNIGADFVAKARPDGYTLLMSSGGPLAVNATLYKNLPFDNLKDFTPISLVADVPNMLVVNPKTLAVKTFEEFIALVKASPGKFFIASTGNGTSPHLTAEVLKQRAGIDLTHVPYRGAGAVTDLLTGSVDCMFATTPSVIQLVRAGKLRALGVTSLKRVASAPDIPTIDESGLPGFQSSTWFGMVGPAGLPREIVAKLQGEIARALKDSVLHEKFVQQGADPVGSTAEEFGEYMRSETARWAKVVKAAHLSVD